MDDLVSEGNIGMLQAARAFDPSRGKSFVTFAAPYVRAAIGKAIEQQAGLYRVPRDAKDSTLEKRRSRALSIDAPVGGSAELSLSKVIPDHDAPNPDQELRNALLTKELSEILESLEQRDRHVVQRFYGLGVESRTMVEIAAEMGLKRERVRQIRDHAVRKIMKLTREASLKDYFKN